MARIGYARVSTRDQHPEVQTERLEAAGCTRIYTDHGASGAKASRPEWDKCLERLEPGDALVCVKLDRIGRSLTNMIEIMNMLRDRKIDLIVLDQPVDTTTPMGRAMYGLLAVFAELEREIIIERTLDGLASTTARGRNGGRKHLLTIGQTMALRTMREARDEDGKRIYSIPDLQAAFPVNGRPVSRQTVYRALGMMDDSPRSEDRQDDSEEHLRWAKDRGAGVTAIEGDAAGRGGRADGPAVSGEHRETAASCDTVTASCSP